MVNITRGLNGPQSRSGLLEKEKKNIYCAYGDSNPEPSSQWFNLYSYQGSAHKVVINNSSATFKINKNSLRILTKLQCAWQQPASVLTLRPAHFRCS